jgi:hypothetical protein
MRFATASTHQHQHNLTIFFLINYVFQYLNNISIMLKNNRTTASHPYSAAKQNVTPTPPRAKPFTKQNQTSAQASSQDSGGQQHGDEFVYRVAFAKRHSTSMSAGKKKKLYRPFFQESSAALFLTFSLSEVA